MRLSLLVLLGIAAFSFSVPKQVWYLVSAPEHFVLLGVGAIGLCQFARRLASNWQASRPIALPQMFLLALCLALGVVAVECSLEWLGVAAAVFYFGTLLSFRVSKAEWRSIRPVGSLALLWAHPLADPGSFLATSYQHWVLRGASALLDGFGVCNVIESNRVDGLNASIAWLDIATFLLSGSALFACASVLVLRRNLRFIPGAFLLSGAVAIGYVMIAARAAIVVGMNAAGSLIWVNMLSFAVGLYLVWVCLCLVRFAFGPIHGKARSNLVSFWNRLTVSRHASVGLHEEQSVLSAKNSETFRLPTIAAIKRSQEERSGSRVAWVRRLIKAVALGFVSTCSFVNHWCRSRRYKRLLPAIPLILIVGFVWISPKLRPQIYWQETQLSDRYTGELAVALESNEGSSIELLARRLSSFSDLSDASSLVVAKGLVAIDKATEAESILKKLVDDPANPYAPAQLWQAKRLLGDSGQPPTFDRRVAKKYLRQAALDETLAAESNWLLGQILLQEGDDENALNCFRSISKPHPETSLYMALIYQQRGDSVAYRRCLSDAESTCRERLLSPDDSAQQIRLLLARSLQLQERFAEAIDVLERSPDFAADAVVRQAALVVDIAWFHSLPAEQSAQKQAVLQHAIKLDAAHPLLQKTVAAIAASRPTDNNQELQQIANELLIEVTDSAKLTGTSLTILGTKAVESGDFVEAERLFREAIATGAESPLALNNLAWLLTKKSVPEQTNEALGLINRALSMNSRLAELWKTRAEIRELLGQPLEAIADLERAIQLGDRTPEVRMKLAELYEIQNDPETAKKYRKLASESR